MQCQFCQAKATIFFTQSIEGKETNMSLCQTCAEERGIGDPSQVLDKISTANAHHAEPLDLISEEGKAEAGNKGQPKKENEHCPACGFSTEDFEKVGRLGCPSCYIAFDEELKSRISRLHKGDSYKGTVPKKYGKNIQTERQLKKLHETLKIAISQEDYETASTIKEQIATLQQSGAPNA